jgi:nitroreductase
MDVFESIRDSKDCRNYSTDPVSSELLMKLVEAGHLAPAGTDGRPREFVVITNVSSLRELSKLDQGCSFLAHAAACIAVFCDIESGQAVEDGTAACQNIMLAAVGLGLGACRARCDQKSCRPAIGKLLSVPAHLELIGIIGLGHPGEDSVQEVKRPALEEVLHWQHF